MKKTIVKVTIKPSKKDKSKKIMTTYEHFAQQQQYYPDLTLDDLRVSEERILS